MNPSIVKRCLVGAVLAIAATLPGFQQLHTSVEGLKLIADYEGCRLQPYQCSAGVWTDGIGNTSGVIPGKTITERQAAEGLISNVLRVERALERCVKQQPPQKVYDAAVSFAFNVGTGNACSSTLVKLLNQRRWADACRQLPRWVYVKGVFNQGLDIQRVLEKVNALPQDKRLSAMTMLFGKEFGDDAAKLANNLPELQRQLKLTAGNDALGSMQKESDINKDSLSAQWLLVKTGAQNTFSSLGETLRQPLMDILYTVKSITGALRRWVEANPELTGTLMKVAAVVAAVTVGLGTLAVALAAVLGPLAVIRLGFSVLGIKTLPSVTAAVTRISSALSWLAGAPLALLRRGLASSGNAAGLLTAPLSSLRRTASLTGNVLKTVVGVPVALLRSGLSGLRAVAVMFMNPLAALRGGLAAAGAVLRVLASGPLAMLRVALYAISGLLGALLSPIGLVVTALVGVALVVWKYWQPITAFLAGVVEGFKAAAGPISAAFEPLKPVFQWIGDKVQALWGWFTDLLTPVKSTSAELQSAAAMGRRFGEALAEGLNMVMHPLDSLKSGVSWLLEKLGIVSKEAAKAKLPERVTRQQPATVNADGKVMMPSGGFPSWGYGFAGMYDSGGYIPCGQFGIVGENGPEIVNGPANVTSRRNTSALAAVVAGMMGVAAAPAELPPLHPLALPAKGGEAMVSRAATVPPVQRIEAPTQIIIQTQPGQSAQDIAREVARQLDERERRLKAKARSNYSDQGGYDA
ncbi:phage tail tape measure protein [Escherichia coli]|nr:phage tail tape measure protein [Escherichia coli]MDC9173459.1 phage tail tape measure protein [Escherichia coli]